MKKENLVLSKRVDKRSNYHRRRIGKLVFRAFTLRQSERLIHSNEGPFALTKG